MEEKIIAYGHSNILGTHKTTIEITKESNLTKRGNCIIGVSASKACADLREGLKKKLKTSTKFRIVLKISELKEEITGYGSPDLLLTSKEDIVLRKSSYIDDRTLLIKCNKACADLSREFIEKLKKPGQKLKVSLSVA